MFVTSNKVPTRKLFKISDRLFRRSNPKWRKRAQTKKKEKNRSEK